MTTSNRLTRMHSVLALRLGAVRCAIEAVYHRHNVAAILRTCDALGVHGVHLVGAEAGDVAPGPARGAERWLDLRTHDGPDAAIDALEADGFAVYVADISQTAVLPEAVPLDRPVCLWFGAELVGVSPRARARATGVVSIPMVGMAQSLNVSVAAAMALRPVADRFRATGSQALLSASAQRAVLDQWLVREQGNLTAMREENG